MLEEVFVAVGVGVDVVLLGLGVLVLLEGLGVADVDDALGVELALLCDGVSELLLGVDEADADALASLSPVSEEVSEELEDGVLVSAGPTAITVSRGTLSVSDFMRVELSATPSTKVVL